MKLRLKSANSLRSSCPSADQRGEALDDWMQLAARSLGVELQPVEAPYPQVASFVRACGPAILRVSGGPTGFLAVLRRRWGRVELLTPELKIRRIPARKIREALCQPLDTHFLPELQNLLDQARITGRRRKLVLTSILQERLAFVSIEDCWLLRAPRGASLFSQLREHRLISNLSAYLTTYALDYLLTLASWWVIGRGALQGRLDLGWLMAWALLLLTRVPLRALTTWKQGVIAVRAGTLIKTRLLAGTLRLIPEEVRNKGVGQLLGTVIESEALESMALSGGLTGIAALIEILVILVVLGWGASNLLLAAVLAAWTLLLFGLARGYLFSRLRWTQTRLRITDELVEHMTGHRTRLAQEPREDWHRAEDAALEGYLDSSARLDRSVLPLIALVPRGWIFVSLLCLAPRMVSGHVDPAALAIAFGGILLGQSTLQKLTESLAYLAGAWIAWRQAKLPFESAAREDLAGAPNCLLPPTTPTDASGPPRPFLEANGLTFHHAARTEKALDNCRFRVFDSDRILLNGSSGSGKSTLAAIIAGLREPESGLMVLRGLDRQSLGSHRWRRMIAFAPQANENHVFSGTLAFNLLMGRRWPPRAEEYDEAEKVCRELGLGELLDRMPAGLDQLIGETGWQLSYGERSRLFLARALLQGAEFVILDESLGALDPETLSPVAQCIDRRAPSLMVIAHP